MSIKLKIGTPVKADSIPHQGIVVGVDEEFGKVVVLTEFNHKEGGFTRETINMSEVTVVRTSEADMNEKWVRGVKPGVLVKTPDRPHWNYVLDVTPDRKYATVLPRFNPEFHCYFIETIHMSHVVEVKEG